MSIFVLFTKLFLFSLSILLPGCLFCHRFFADFRSQSPTFKLISSHVVGTIILSLFGIIIFFLRIPHTIASFFWVGGLLIWLITELSIAVLRQTSHQEKLRAFLSVTIRNTFYLAPFLLCIFIASYFLSLFPLEKYNYGIGWDEAVKRVGCSMDPVNILQYRIANNFYNTEPIETHFNIDGKQIWSAGDRPMLIGLLSATYGVIGFCMSVNLYYLQNMYLSSFLIIGLYALLRQYFEYRKSTVITLILLVTLHPIVFNKMFYTIPKLPGVAFVFCGVYLFFQFLRKSQSWRRAFLGSCSFGLAFVCHSTCIFGVVAGSLFLLLPYPFRILRHFLKWKIALASVLPFVIIAGIQIYYIGAYTNSTNLGTRVALFRQGSFAHPTPPMTLIEAFNAYLDKTGVSGMIEDRKKSLSQAFGQYKNGWSYFSSLFDGTNSSEFQDLNMAFMYLPVMTYGLWSFPIFLVATLTVIILSIMKKRLIVSKEYILILCGFLLLLLFSCMMGCWTEVKSAQIPNSLHIMIFLGAVLCCFKLDKTFGMIISCLLIILFTAIHFFRDRYYTLQQYNYLLIAIMAMSIGLLFLTTMDAQVRSKYSKPILKSSLIALSLILCFISISIPIKKQLSFTLVAPSENSFLEIFYNLDTKTKSRLIVDYSKTQGLRNVSLDIPDIEIKSIRLDPGSGKGEIKLKRMSICVNYLGIGLPLYVFSIKQMQDALIPIKNCQTKLLGDEELLIKCFDSDPSLQVVLNFETLEKYYYENCLDYIVYFKLIVVLTCVLILIGFLCYANSYIYRLISILKNNRKNVFLSSILALVFLLIFVLCLQEGILYRKKIVFNIAPSTESSFLQIFWNVWDPQSAKPLKTFKKSDQAQSIGFYLPGMMADPMRIDPGSGKGEIRLQSMELQGELLGIEIPLYHWTPKKILEDFKKDHNVEFELLPDTLKIVCTGGDPYFISQIPVSSLKKLHDPRRENYAWAFKIGMALALCLLFGVACYILRSTGERFVNLIKRKTVLFTLTVSTFLIATGLTLWVNYHWSDQIFSEGPPALFQAMGFATQLVFCAMTLFVIGHLISGSISSPRSSFYSRRHGILIKILIGQIGLFFYIYIRSALNCLLHFVIPITFIDVLFIIGILAFIAIRRGNLSLRAFNGAIIMRHLYVFLILWGFLSIIAYHELPRITNLSSDPDLHMFFCKQIDRFGTIPYFHQFYWGKKPLSYPAGFAVLNFIWHMISKLDIRNIIMVQFIVQSLLTALLVVETAFLLPAIRGIRKSWVFAVTVLIIPLAFFLYIPLGYSANHWHLEGTGRMSSMFLLGSSFSLLNIAIFKFNYLRRANLFYFITFALTVVAAFLINPVNILYPGMFFGTSCVIYLLRNFSWRSLFTLGVSGIMFLFVFIDHYYLKMIVEKFQPSQSTIIEQISNKTTETTPSFLPHLFSRYIDSLKSDLSTPTSWLSVFTFRHSLDSKTAFIYLLALLGLGLICLLIGTKPGKTYLWRTCQFIALPLVVLVTALIVLPLFSLVAESMSGGYLIPLYSQYERMQILTIWILFVLAAIFSFVFDKLRLGGTLFIMLIFLNCYLLLPQSQFFEPLTKSVSTKWLHDRKKYPGSMGGVKREDIKVIQQVEKLFTDYQAKNSNISFDSIPKILIHNACLNLNNEKWLFSFGAARILPLYNVFPVAFYYGHGSDAFSWENYKEHVAERLDLEWLKKHNIKYVFISSDNCGGIFEMGELKKRHKVLFNEGNCYFIELF